MVHYILQTVIFQLLFLLIYDVFLKKETFFNWNRFYLLASALLSIVLPFIKINSFSTVIPKEYIYVLPEIIIGNANNTINTSQAIVNNVSPSTITFSWDYILYLGSAIALSLFAFKFYKLIAMAYKNPKVRFEKAFLVELANSKHAFSFFNYIFLGKDINKEDRQTILTHELQHVREKHSLDLLFLEILKIIFWFNPLIYMYQKRIANLHEFIADSKAIKSSSKVNYYQNLLSQVFDTQKVSFINPFFKQSLIKKRIIMLSKSKSKQIHLAKYLLVFPMVIGMLFYTSCSNEEKINQSVEANSKVSEEELFQKYTKEIKVIEKEIGGLYGPDRITYYKDYKENENYIQTRDLYIRYKAFNNIMLTEVTERSYKGKEEGPTKDWIDFIEELRNKTYATYLEEKKTSKSIKDWESQAPSFYFRKYVKDLDNITAEEQQVIDKQVEEIRKDGYSQTQIISDGLRHKKNEFKVQENEEEKVSISFVTVEKTPTYPGCDTSASNDDQRKCLSESINKLVMKNWNTELGKSLGLTGKQRIYTRFTINKEGNIVDVKVRGPHPALEKEARRVVKLIPKVEPAKQDGKPVNVTFDLPISFNIQE